VQGRFRPGERLREVPLAAELQVSRIPLHLALERLAHEGFLQLRSTRGFIVQSFSQEDIRDAVELRGVLEGAAARRATERIQSSSELDELRQINQETLELLRRREFPISAFHRFIELNAAFHQALLELSGSRMLRRAVEQVCTLPFASPSAFLSRQYVSPELKELFVIAADQHVAMVDAIEHHESMRAEVLAREHARMAIRNLEEALRHPESVGALRGAGLVHL